MSNQTGAKLTARLVLALWMAGFIASGIIQSIFQKWFASVTLWGANSGWQTEIAVWNLGMTLVAIPALKNEERARHFLPGLFTLSLLFFINHLLAAFHTPGGPLVGNIAGAASNALAFILCLFFWSFN